CAACDLWGKIKNQPLWKIWGYSVNQVPMSSYDIGLDSVERMTERIQEAPDWPAYRIQLGDSFDLDILRYLRQYTTSPFHVDVNGGWNIDNAIKYLPHLHELRVETVEQPLPASDWDGMHRLKKAIKKGGFKIMLIADESWRTEDDLEECAKCFDAINVKLVKCGGLIRAKSFIAKAKHLGLKLTCANTIESTVAVSAHAQLASAFDWLALSGPLLIEKKVADGLRVDAGKLIYPDENGTGIRVPFR
ncbi:MAG: mandelate racemase/muconate lactonizing enzyme family protein, partial [Thermoguttaceae bacterium]